MAHLKRPAHDRNHPVHVSMRAVQGAPSLRNERVFAGVRREIERAVASGLRIVHFSIQGDHVHLVVEASDRVSLWRGVQRFSSRVARRVNRMVGRRGSLWRDRYHRRDLTSPRQVRNTLVYILFNVRKHGQGSAREMEVNLETLDECSSVAWLDGWDPRARPPPHLLEHLLERVGASPLAAPKTWLAHTGWKRAGLIPMHATPRMR